MIEAKKLLDSIMDMRKHDDYKHRIVFIGQDVGAILIKNALVLATNDLARYGDICFSTRAIIMLGCPQRYLTIHQLRNDLMDLMKDNISISEDAWLITRGLAQWITDVNYAFAETEMTAVARMISVYSAPVGPGRATFDEFSSTTSLPLEIRVAAATTQDEMKLSTAQDEIQTILHRFLFDIDIPEPVHAKDLYLLASQACPQFPLENALRLPEHIGNIADNLIFHKWQKGSGMQHLVLLTNNEDIGAQIAEFLFHQIDEGTPRLIPCMYFAFNHSDCRYNTVETMIYTFLTQFVTLLSDSAHASIRTSFHEILKTFTYFSSWNLDDLYAFLLEILLLVGTKTGGLVWVLSNLDSNISSSNWLLSKLNKLARECELNFKILITHANESNISEHLESWMRWDLRKIAQVNSGSISQPHSTHDGGKVSTELTEISSSTHLPSDLVRLVQARPFFSNIAQELNILLKACGKDTCLREMILSWYQARAITLTPDELLREITQLQPVQPHAIFNRILASFPEVESLRVWRVLKLLLHCFRPLGIAEFEDFEQLVEGLTSTTPRSETSSLANAKLQQSFYGLLKLRRNRVDFAHPLLRKYLLSENSDFSCVPQECHQQIATLCLKYINHRIPQLHGEWMQEAGADSLANSRETFFIYAVKYWPEHIRLANFAQTADNPDLSTLLRNPTTLANWAKIYWNLSNPWTRRSSMRANPLVILVSCGLGNVVLSVLEKRIATVYQFIQQPSLLIEAAARQGDILSVKKFLDWPMNETETMDDAVLASADEQIFTELLRFCIKKPCMVQNPVKLFYRSVLLGSESCLEMLQPLITEANEAISTAQRLVTLKQACLRGHQEIVKKLLNDGFVSDQPFAALEAICKFGEADAISPAVKLAFNNSVEEDRDFGNIIRTVIQTAKYRALDSLAKALKSHEYDTQFQFTEKMVELIAETKYAKCCQIWLENTKRFINPTRLEFEEAMNIAIAREYRPLYHGLLQIKGAVANGRLSTMLQFAIEQTKNVEILECLWGAEAKVYARIEAFTAALNYAAMTGNQTAVSFLVTKKVDLDARNTRERTPLFEAAWIGCVKIVKILIQKGANVEAIATGGWRPLHAAYDNAAITRLLLEKEADPNLKNDSAETSLHIATKWGYHDTVKTILEFNPSMETKQEALVLAITNNNEDIVDLLLDAGADPSRAPSNGTSLLLEAVIAGRSKLVKRLLEYSIPLETAKDKYDLTILNRAVLCTPTGDVDRFSIVKYLVNRGADIESADVDGYTSLTQAVCMQNEEVVKYLISRGAKVDIEGKRLGGPLVRACYESSFKLVKLLCENSSDVNIDSTGICGAPIHAALYRKPSDEKENIVKYLVKEAKVDINKSCKWWGPPLNLASLTGSLESMQLLLNEGADIEAADVMGRRPIHFALYRTKEHVELLYQRGANLFARDRMERSGLHLAVVSGRRDLVSYILEKGEGRDLVNAEDSDGWTPLLWAVRRYPLVNTEALERRMIIKDLLEKGADLYHVGSGAEGEWNALKLARYYNLGEDILEELGQNAKHPDGSYKWDIWSRTIGKGHFEGGDRFCDACLTAILGLWYTCDTCPAFWLCFKCYQSINIIHPKHPFTDEGFEIDYECERGYFDDDYFDDQESDEETFEPLEKSKSAVEDILES
ncbi:ankyrin repeat-containing domain protein [Camillea tinctor]|nr:ankyrin repeat-containing domain protein [Camillea tinctor]